MHVYIGTSGYSYSDWRGRFYPEDLSPSQMLTYYGKHFSSVEINMTFYRTPFQNVVKGWYKKTPDNFRFVCKGARYITHIQRLKTTPDSLDKFFSPLSELREKLICILWQLPPSLKQDLSLLKEFLSLVKQHPTGKRLIHCIEFRNNSWFKEKVYQILENHQIGLVWYDTPNNRWPTTPDISTGNTIYLRFHGKTALYRGSYSEDDLLSWVKKIKKHQKGLRFLFAFFNNDYNADGVFDALKFKKILLNEGILPPQ